MAVDITKPNPISSQVSRAHQVLRQTYLLLGAMLSTTAITSLVVQAMGIKQMNFLILLAGFYGLIYLVNRNRNSIVGLGWTFALTVFMGFSLGPVLNSVMSMSGGSSLVANAFLMTAFAFFGLSGYALRTKRDLKFLEGFLVAGFIVLMSGVLLSLVFNVSGLSMALSMGFVLFSSAAILYETQRIVRGGEDNYIMAAVSLYVSLYNLFLSLLNLLGLASND